MRERERVREKERERERSARLRSREEKEMEDAVQSVPGSRQLPVGPSLYEIFSLKLNNVGS